MTMTCKQGPECKCGTIADWRRTAKDPALYIYRCPACKAESFGYTKESAMEHFEAEHGRPEGAKGEMG